MGVFDFINKQKEEFESMDIDEQISHITLNILWRELNILKIYINHDGEKFDYYNRVKLFYFNSLLFKSLENRVIHKSGEDEKYKNDVTNGINVFLKNLMKVD